MRQEFHRNTLSSLCVGHQLGGILPVLTWLALLLGVPLWLPGFHGSLFTLFTFILFLSYLKFVRYVWQADWRDRFPKSRSFHSWLPEVIQGSKLHTGLSPLTWQKTCLTINLISNMWMFNKFCASHHSHMINPN